MEAGYVKLAISDNDAPVARKSCEKETKSLQTTKI